MKLRILFILLLMTSGQLFCQSIKQQDEELELKLNLQADIIDSLFIRESKLNDSICKLQYLNKTSIHWLVELYNETEEKKYRMFFLFDQTSDTLMNWDQFYRYEIISLDMLNAYRSELEFRFSSESSVADGMAIYLSARKRMKLKERNAYLQKQIVFNSLLITDLMNSLGELENQLAIHILDYLKLASWREIVLKTKNYCSKKHRELEKKPRMICGEDFLEAMASDSIRKEKLVSTDFDEAAQFPGGFDKLKSYLDKEVVHLDIPLEKSVGSMKVYVKFIVTDNGEIRNVIVTKASDCISCDLDVVEIIQNMPRWIPATKRGNPVSSEFRLPIRLN
jgi:hypothetical protein